jgi:cytochrome c-type biogenesis protein CcmH
MLRSWLLLVACFVAVLGGCNRNMEPYVPGEEPRQPDLSKIFPAGSEAPAVVPGMPAGPEGGRGAPPVAAAAGAPIRGTVTVSEDLSGAVPAGAVLFVVARRGSAGPPTAVKRIAEPRFPLQFEIGPEDRMIQSMPFEGPFTLTARIDADGNATSRQAGDLEAGTPITVENGAQSALLVIDRRV